MQVINYDAITKNVEFFRRRLGQSKLCAVLKNNAYGHGLTHVARQISELVDCFAVGCVDEAEQIAFLKKDILILLPQNLRNAEKAIKAGYILTVDSFVTLEIVDKAAKSVDKIARAHLKIDSGMSRLGFNYSQLNELFARLNNSAITVEGVFSHFYGENADDCDRQLQCFEGCLSELQTALNKPLIAHIANTGAALLSSKYHLDMARIGLGLYGYGHGELLPAKKVCADVIGVKSVSIGSVVGYGAKYKCERNSRIAVLNIGYANGLQRCLVGSKVTVNGQKCPIVAICMAMCMLDVTDVEVNVGDTAVLLGDGINISNDEVIIYELLCNLR